jgi:hypothetical protein
MDLEAEVKEHGLSMSLASSEGLGLFSWWKTEGQVGMSARGDHILYQLVLVVITQSYKTRSSFIPARINPDYQGHH